MAPCPVTQASSLNHMRIINVGKQRCMSPGTMKAAAPPDALDPRCGVHDSAPLKLHLCFRGHCEVQWLRSTAVKQAWQGFW